MGPTNIMSIPQLVWNRSVVVVCYNILAAGEITKSVGCS